MKTIMKPKIYFILHLENYRIGFVTLKTWMEKSYSKKMKHWFFYFEVFWPNYSTQIFQLYILGLGFGYKRLIK